MIANVFTNKEKPGKMSQTTILKTGVSKPMTFLDVEDFNRKIRIIINAAETSTTRSLMISDETFLTAIKRHLTFPVHVWRDNETYTAYLSPFAILTIIHGMSPFINEVALANWAQMKAAPSRTWARNQEVDFLN